jgi:hypothetical protein
MNTHLPDTAVATRYEKKYRIEGMPPAWIEQAFRWHPARFRVLHPVRQINNIYFDTPDLEEFYQNVAGIPQRRKHRLRWYGPDHHYLQDPVFEIKIKDGEMGTKQSQSLASMDWAGLRSAFHDIPALRYLPLRPVLVNTYQRSYWGSADGNFRLTVDWDIRFAPFHWGQSPRPTHFVPDTAAILELKYDAQHDDLAQGIFDHLPFRQTKNSKFVTGVGLVMG